MLSDADKFDIEQSIDNERNDYQWATLYSPQLIDCPDCSYSDDFGGSFSTTCETCGGTGKIVDSWKTYQFRVRYSPNRLEEWEIPNSFAPVAEIGIERLFLDEKDQWVIKECQENEHAYIRFNSKNYRPGPAATTGVGKYTELSVEINRVSNLSYEY